MYLLITGAFNRAEQNKEWFEKTGYNTIFLQNEKDELPCAYEEVEGVICNGLFLYHDIKKFVNLKFIQLTSAGFDRVDMKYVKAHDIKIFNAKGVYSIPMAEYSVFGVLSLYKKAKEFYKNQKEKKWEKQREITELFGKTVCIIGCGNVGSCCAKRFLGFDTKVIGVDLFVVDNPVFEKIYGIKDINKALYLSDIVVLTLPLTQETENMFDDELFSEMKDGAVFVNIARGKIVNTNALIKALKTKLYGAVLDVFEEEPLSEDSPLWNMENVIITPHNSFVGEGNGNRLENVIKENLKVKI